jgi:hypothetical protein
MRCFMASGFSGDPRRATRLRNAANGYAEQTPLIAEFMDGDPLPWLIEQNKGVDPRERISAALGKEGLSYRRGGYIHGASLTGPSRSLAESEGLRAVEIEFDRAYQTVESDPGAAVTAACAILESVCKTYLELGGLVPPKKQVLGTLWPEVANHLGLSPKEVADDDLKRILQGLYSIGDGIAALRTHEGSAHGQSSAKSYRIEPRHARLAVHAAHTMAMFVLETREAQKGPGSA